MNTNTYKTTNTIRKPATASIAMLITTIFLGSCTANAGYRHYGYEPATSKSIEYHYFPNADVYYDSHRRIYHYRHQQRGWISVKKLPKYIHIDKHRRYSMRSDHHKPWKNQHLQKKHRKHFDRHDKKASRPRDTYKAHSPQHSFMIDQARNNRSTAQHEGNHSYMKHRVDVHKQGKDNGQHVLKGAEENVRPAYKITESNSNNKHTTADKNTGRKIKNTQHHQKNERRRADTKQGKNHVASDNRPGRDGDKRRRK